MKKRIATVATLALGIGLVLALIWRADFVPEEPSEARYVCPPCGLDCDALAFEKDGVCPHCRMNLIMGPAATILNAIRLEEGSGNFLIEGGAGREGKSIRVFYHRPKQFNQDSQVLLVLHGAGRNGHDYRDAWIKASEKYNVLILAPTYTEQDYPRFWNYNLAGMLKDVKINAEQTEMESFTRSQNPEAWIFGDYDRIFEVVKRSLHLTRNRYDMFGHSAGGQVLHRLALFRPGSKANRILAANSGWYTVPDLQEDFPTGLRNSVLAVEPLDFSAKLVLFLGEKDNADETRGDLRHRPELDRQGLHRLARGQYFYKTAQQLAGELGRDFQWRMEIVPGIGHDYRGMSEAAATYLYAGQNKRTK